MSNDSRPTGSPMPFWMATLLFFFSGFSALVYELLWMRHLGLILGNTTHAATTVLVAYMGGLALGSEYFGRRAAKVLNPLRLFGALEIVIGLYALAAPVLFDWMQAGYRGAFAHGLESPVIITSTRFVFALLILVVPTVCMGGSLPAIAHGLVRQERRFGAGISRLYGVNTLGAVAGLLATGFFFIEQFGIHATNLIAAAANLAVGLTAVLAGRAAEPEKAAKPEPVPPSAVNRRDTLAVLLGVGVGGFIALALEVVWFRALVLVFGSTTYSFSAMLGVFLAGISLGALAFGWISDRTRRPLTAFALAEILIGLYTMFSLRWFNDMPLLLLRFLVDHSFSWPGMMAARFGITLLFLLAPTLLMGFAFTVAARVMRRQTHVSSRAVGAVYAWNTVGGMFGAFAGGFLLLPLLGAERSLILLGIAAVALGILIILLSTQRGAFASGLAISAIVLGPCVYASHPGWNHKLMAAGPYFSPWTFVSGTNIVFRERINSEELLLYREGLVANVSVSRSDEQKIYFSSDGKVEADTSPRSMMLQRMMGHVPLLFHPNPRRALNIGLGAGVTFGAVSCHPLERFEVVEIEPAVPSVARLFGPWNHHVMDREDKTLTLGDGRNHLLCTTQRYDVITADPFEPVYTGANNLYVVEHFRNARACLADGGIMCQYLPLYELSPADFSMIVRSFVSVFPESVMFFTGDDTLMLGFKDKVALDAGVLRTRFEVPAVKQSLAEMGITSPERVLGMFVADLRHTNSLFGAGPLNTDDKPAVEFSAPRNALRFTPTENQKLLLENFSAVPEEFLKGLDGDQRKLVENNGRALKKMLEGNFLYAQGEASRAFKLLQESLELAPDNPVIRESLITVIMASADNLRDAGEKEEAIYQYEMALKLRPSEFFALFHLVDLFMKTEQAGRAGEIIEAGLKYYPDSAIFIGLKGRYVAATQQDFAAAAELLRQAVIRAPWKPELWNDYAWFAGESGDQFTAIAAAREAEELMANPFRDDLQ